MKKRFRFIALVFQESDKKERHPNGIALPQKLINRSGCSSALPYPVYEKKLF